MIRCLPDDYVEALPAMPFWQAIVKDRELFPEVRNNAVTVYYRGAALIRELRLERGTFTGKTHVRYIPCRSTASTSVGFQSNSEGLQFSHAVEPLPLAHADAQVLKAYKTRMKLIGGPEREVIHSLCCHSANVIVDQEIKFQLAEGGNSDKLDILAFDPDPAASTYCFIEVKSITDPRLRVGRDGLREVASQLNQYGQRIQAHADEIRSAIENIVSLKSRLGLGDRVAACQKVDPNRILAKPVLVIGGCNDQEVRAIFQRQRGWDSLIDSLQDVAAGLVLCSKEGTRLNLAEGRQRHWFDQSLVALEGSSPQ